ncbi:MAG: acylphosphatase [archaeon]|nr:MAG: acylphosphatase [archaeon]
MKVAKMLIIDGLVHGVLFRASMARLASQHGVRGWVKNLADGSVQAHLEGEPYDVALLVEWARRGPPRARVDSVIVREAAVRRHHDFKIEG